MTKRLVALLLTLTLVFGTLGLTAVGAETAAAPEAPAAKLKAPEIVTVNGETAVKAGDGRTDYTYAYISGYDADGNWKYANLQFDKTAGAYVRIVNEWSDADFVLSKLSSVQFNKNVSSDDGMSGTVDSARYDYNTGILYSAETEKGTKEYQNVKYSYTYKYSDGTSDTHESNQTVDKSENIVIVRENYNTENGKVSSYTEETAKRTYTTEKEENSWDYGSYSYSYSTFKAVVSTEDSNTSKESYSYNEKGVVTDTSKDVYTTKVDGKTSTQTGTKESSEYDSESGKMTSTSKNTYSDTKKLDVELTYTDRNGKQQPTTKDILTKSSNDRTTTSYDAKSGKQTQVTHEITEITGDEKTRTTSEKTETTNYDPDTEKVSSTFSKDDTRVSTANISEYGWLNYRNASNNGKSEEKQYDEEGTYTGKTERTYEYKYSTEDSNWGEQISSKTTRKEYDAKDVLTSTSEDESSVTYNTAKDTKNYKSAGSTASYDHGTVIATGKSSSASEEKYEVVPDLYDSDWDSEKQEWVQVPAKRWVEKSSSEEKTRYNAAGTVIYSYKESSKGDDKSSEEMSYDEFGKLSSGSKSNETKTTYHYESYDRNGIRSTTDRTKDDAGRPTKETIIRNYNVKDGKNIKSYESISEPEYQKNDDGIVLRTLNHTKRYDYDSFGGVLDAHTFDQTYSAADGTTTSTYTIVNYVGKPVEAEMHDKVVSVTVNYGSEKNYDYSTTRTTYDWDGSVETIYKSGRETTIDKNDKRTTTTTSGTFAADGKTLIDGSVTIDGYDAKGNSYYKYTSANNSGYNYVYERGYDADGRWYSTEDRTESDGTRILKENKYDKTAGEYTNVATYYDADQKLIGKEQTGVSQYDKNKSYIGYDNIYTNAKGEVVYKYQVRNTENGTTYTYVDANGKEIGYRKYDSTKGTSENKVPVLDEETFTLNGWTEYTSTPAKAKNDAGEEVTYSVTTNKTYNADSILTYESKADNYGTSFEKHYTEEGKLKSDVETDAKNQTTSSYYDNPGDVLSKVEKTGLLPTTDKDTGRVTSRVNSDVAYYGLDGKLDRHTIETVSYEYDKDGNRVKTTTTTEYRDSTDKAIVTKTGVEDTTNKNNWKEETTKADGTVIGYVKYSGFESEKKERTYYVQVQNTDSAGYTYYSYEPVTETYYEYSDYGTVEKVVPTINQYTGKVISTEETKKVTNKDGSSSTTTVNKEGNEVTYESSEIVAKDGSVKENEKYYNDERYDNKGYYLSYESSYTYDAATETDKGEGKTYRYSGKVANSWTSEGGYDKDQNMFITKENHYNSDGELVFVKEYQRKTTAYGEYDTTDIENITYLDANGKEIGYEKYDAAGNNSTKIPNVSYSGNLDGSWTESTTSADGMKVTSKTYDENGLLTEESSYTYAKSTTRMTSSYPNSLVNYGSYVDYNYVSTLQYGGYYGGNTDSNIISGTKKTYWANSTVVNTQTDYTDLGNGKIEKVTTVNNEDGSLRTKSFEEEGRQTGTHFIDKSITFYAADASGLGQFLYGYEYRNDLQKDEITWTYTDASGKIIGHSKTENPDGSWSILQPNLSNVSGRTGKIQSYHEYGEDKNGNAYDIYYDADMKETSRSQVSENEDGDQVRTNYVYGKAQPASITVDGVTTRYNSKGEVLGSYDSDSHWSDTAILDYEYNYYNQKGDLTYSRLEGVDTAAYLNDYTLYLGSDGKEIGRVVTDDDGNYYSRTPQATIANNIYGYEEYINQDGGKVTIRRGYDKDNKLIGETYWNTSRVITDDQVVTTTTNKDGRTLEVETREKNADNETEKSTVKYYSSWDGRYTGEDKTYYTDPLYTEVKSYDENGNVTWYGWRWNYNDYSFLEDYWVNGQLQQYYWDDELNNSYAEHNEYYNPNGTYSSWYDMSEDGKVSSYWLYDENGVLRMYSETNGDVTNITYYNADGSISGYDWGITNPEKGYGDGQASDSVVWNATSVLYKKHIVSNPDDKGTIETWTDNAGNVKTITRADETTSTVKLASTADGWQQAFGDEWYYVEGGKLATGWKVVGGTWYYFNEDGQMATGTVLDGSTTYVLSDSGAWNANGWSQDANGDWAYSENGVAATGWRNIGGIWYYFEDGWVIDYGEYDSQTGWKQYTPGTMVTGAAHIWNADWSDTVTYFFNADGSWDTSAGWKSDGINYYYFFEGGARATGWQLIDGTWYYFNDKGIMRNGWVSSGPSWYYMNENGAMAANSWIQERFEDDWYYADGSGLMATGWKQIDGTWYYFDASGVMAANEWVGNYYQDANGAMVTGWNLIDDNWYYMGDSGEAQYGWQQIGGVWYYFKDDASMATGEVEIGGVVNVFDGSGAWQGTK